MAQNWMLVTVIDGKPHARLFPDHLEAMRDARMLYRVMDDTDVDAFVRAMGAGEAFRDKGGNFYQVSRIVN